MGPEGPAEVGELLKGSAEALKELPEALKVGGKVVANAEKFAEGTGQLVSKAESVVGKEITGYTRHGLNQAISRDAGRGVSPGAILDAVKNPTNIVNQSGGVLKYIGSRATVILNKVGKVITTYGEPRW